MPTFPFAPVAACAMLLPSLAAAQALAPTQPTAPPSPADAMAPLDAATYLAKAAAGDRFEIESSRLILAKSPSAKVASFARMMIADHTHSTARLTQAARQDGLGKPAPALDSTQAAALDGLRQAQGETAQNVYLAAQRDAHTAALALHRAYADKGDKPALRAAANAIAPVVARHADMLAQLGGQETQAADTARGR